MKQFFVRWEGAVSIQRFVRGHLTRRRLSVLSIVHYQIDYVITCRLWKQVKFKRSRELLVIGRRNPMEKTFKIVHEQLESDCITFRDLICEIDYLLQGRGKHEEAATTIQRYWRGYIVRSKEFYIRTLFRNEWAERDRQSHEEEKQKFENEFLYEIQMENLADQATAEELEKKLFVA